MSGSSPQARGAQRVLVGTFPRPGLIPAGAGSTFSANATRWERRAHPRRRGEHDGGLGGGEVHTGSSPQARGALTLSRLGGCAEGLIPAGAGSTRGR